jgi:hypothetical protein
MIAMWMVFLHLPARHNVSQMKSRLAVLEERERQQISESKILLMQAVLDSLNIQLKERLDTIYPAEDLGGLGDAVEKLGKEYGLNLVDITPDYRSLSQLHDVNQDLSEIAVTIEFAGRFSAFTRLVDHIDRFPFAMKIIGVALEKNPDEKSDLKIILRGVVFLRKEGVYDNYLKKLETTNRT